MLKSQVRRKEKTKKQKNKDEADKWFSLYIRLSNADWRGYVQCYTCPKIAHYKDYMQNGHFISRKSSTLRFSESNCRVQCYACNVMLKGNYIKYTMRLIKEHGKRFVEKLIEKGKETHQFTEQELGEIANKYKEKVINMSNYEK